MRRGPAAFLRAGARDERGAVAVFFAIALVVLTPLVLGAIDIYMLSIQRARLQDALDAAALYVARASTDDPDEITALGQKALAANIKLLSGAHLSGSTFTLQGNKIVAQAVMQPNTIASHLWPHGDMTVGTEVTRSSMNLEVALVLDVTLSMDDDASGGGGKKIDALKVAASDLIDLIVQDSQTPYYSKIALVPYSFAVNAGAYVDSVRGSPTAGFDVTAVSYASTTKSAKSIQGAVRETPIKIRSDGHGLATGDSIFITGVKGMTQLNKKAWTVTKVDANNITLNGTKKGDFSSYTNSGTITPCELAGCAVTVTASGHNFVNGDKVRTEGLGAVANGTFTAANVTSTKLTLTGSSPTGNSLSGSGGVFCTNYGCKYLHFTDTGGTDRTYIATTSCVTERTGADAYTDAAPSASKVGFHYASSASCPNGNDSPAPITPLSSDKTTLKGLVNAYELNGSTAGQIGLAWGWYMVSPNFGDLWPSSANRPAAYTKTDVLKVVVLMTDGQFNTAHYNGVLSKDSTMSGAKINQNATNGTAFYQAGKLCEAMKAQGITIYTVGFDIGSQQEAIDIMASCATSSGHAYLPSSGTALQTAFKAIAQDINSLRLSH